MRSWGARRALACGIAVGIIAVVGTQPSAAAAGERIAFVSDREGGQTDIWSMDTGGGNLKRLTNDGAEEHGPAFSPDGTQIAYASGADIYVMSADGATQSNVTNSTEEEARPTWSPDGAKLAFPRKYVTKRSTDWDIVIRTLGTGDEVRVAHAGNDVDPDWSSTGTIVFSSSGKTTNLWTTDATGTAPTQLTSFKTPAGQPQWSPDGHKVAFTLWYQGAPGLAIAVIDVSAPSTATRISAGNLDDGPSWSPNGSTIVFRHVDNKMPSTLFTVPSDGSAPPVAIAGQQGNNAGPDWGIDATGTSPPSTPTCVVEGVCL